MADVVVQMRVLPEGIEVDLQKLQAQIKDVLPDNARVYKMIEEPVAFGLKCLKVTVIIPDEEGGTEPVEEAISQIKEVQRVEVEIVSRM